MEVVTGEVHSVHLLMVYRRNHWEQGISSYHHQIFDLRAGASSNMFLKGYPLEAKNAPKN